MLNKFELKYINVGSVNTFKKFLISKVTPSSTVSNPH